MTYTVYALSDERTPDVARYIGFSRNPEARLRAHIAEAQRSNQKSHRLHWLKKLASEGARPIWRALFQTNNADEAAQLEIETIRQLRESGVYLVNDTSGGEGVQGFGGVLSEEALARRTATMNSPEYLAQRSELSATYWSSQEAREHQRQAMVDSWAQPEAVARRERQRALVKAQLADPNYKGASRTAEARAKLRAAKLGKPHPRQRTPEWNAKISAAQKGIPRGPYSPERRAAHIARMNDPETRAKLRAAAHERYRGQD